MSGSSVLITTRLRSTVVLWTVNCEYVRSPLAGMRVIVLLFFREVYYYYTGGKKSKGKREKTSAGAPRAEGEILGELLSLNATDVNAAVTAPLINTCMPKGPHTINVINDI